MSYLGDGKVIKGLGYYQSDATHAWIGSTVDDSGGFFNSLAFNPSGRPAIAYSGGDWNHPLIKYADLEVDVFAQQTVGPGQGWCSLVFTPLGEAAISYVQGPYSHSAVMLAVSSKGNWNIQTVVDSADSPSLAVAPSGELAISYQCPRRHKVRCRYCVANLARLADFIPAETDWPAGMSIGLARRSHNVNRCWNPASFLSGKKRKSECAKDPDPAPPWH
jgi:hypothetical protein